MTEDRERDEGGKFVKSRSPSEVLDSMEVLEPYTTGELSDMLGWPRRTVYQALQELHENEHLRKKKPEPRRAIWIRLPEDTSASEGAGESDTQSLLDL